MADKRAIGQLDELQISVKSRILERIQNEFESGAALAASTQHVKSEGTNYGMHTVSDSAVDDLTDIWERVFSAPTQVRVIGRGLGGQEPGQAG